MLENETNGIRRLLTEARNPKTGEWDRSRAVVFTSASQGRITAEDFARVDAAEAMLEQELQAGRISKLERTFFRETAVSRPEELREFLKARQQESKGHSQPAAHTPLAEIQESILALMEKNSSLTYTQAFSEVRHSNPALVERYNREHLQQIG
jgi:hypothetical protein